MPADDPREWAALQHNLVQVERERVAAVEEMRRRYEESLSWRLTQPLRDPPPPGGDAPQLTWSPRRGARLAY